MQGLDLLQTNLLQPIVLAFLLGGIAGFVKSELELPEAVIKLLAIYLLFSLGMTGGRELAKADMGNVLPLIGVTLLMTFAIPTVAYFITRRLGKFDISNAAAIAAHEIPLEIGDFIVLLNAGYTRRRALAYNLLSGLAAVIGGLVGYFALDAARDALPYVLVLAASSFVYIALADLVPDMQRQRKRGESAVQVGLLLVGIAAIALLTAPLHAH